MFSDVPAWPESRKPAQAEPSEAKLCEAAAGLGVACGSGHGFVQLIIRITSELTGNTGAN